MAKALTAITMADFTLEELAEFMLEGRVECIRQWIDRNGQRWVVSIKCSQGVYRSKPKASLDEAFFSAQDGAEEKNATLSGKIHLADLAHRGLVSLEDATWLVGRFDEKGSYRG